MNYNEITIFDNKTLADVFAEIYVNQQKVSAQVEDVIEDLKLKVESISDATILAPIIKDYLDTTVKNNDTLIKMASIIEKSTQRSSVDEGDDEFSIEEYESIKSEIESEKTNETSIELNGEEI